MCKNILYGNKTVVSIFIRENEDNFVCELINKRGMNVMENLVLPLQSYRVVCFVWLLHRNSMAQNFAKMVKIVTYNARYSEYSIYYYFINNS